MLIGAPCENVVILDSNLPDIEEGIEQFIEGQTYSKETLVQMGEDVFESGENENTDTPIPERTTTSWIYKRKINKLRAFDPKMNTLSIADNEIWWVVESNFIDLIGFFGLQAKEVKVEFFDINDEVMNTPIKTYSEVTQKRIVTTYTNFRTSPMEYTRRTYFEMKPLYNKKMKITISNPQGEVRVGNIGYGRKYDFGLVLVDKKLTTSTRNVFLKERDKTTGEIKVTPVLLYKRLTIHTIIETSKVERTENKFDDLNGIPCLWIALKGNGLPTVMIYGYHEDFDTPIGLKRTERTLRIKGVV